MTVTRSVIVDGTDHISIVYHKDVVSYALSIIYLIGENGNENWI